LGGGRSIKRTGTGPAHEPRAKSRLLPRRMTLISQDQIDSVVGQITEAGIHHRVRMRWLRETIREYSQLEIAEVSIEPRTGGAEGSRANPTHVGAAMLNAKSGERPELVGVECVERTAVTDRNETVRIAAAFPQLIRPAVESSYCESSIATPHSRSDCRACSSQQCVGGPGEAAIRKGVACYPSYARRSNVRQAAQDARRMAKVKEEWNQRAVPARRGEQSRERPAMAAHSERHQARLLPEHREQQ